MAEELPELDFSKLPKQNAFSVDPSKLKMSKKQKAQIKREREEQERLAELHKNRYFG